LEHHNPQVLKERLKTTTSITVRLFTAGCNSGVATAIEKLMKKQSDDRGFARYPSLEGKIVLVTGGATGIGESIVAHFARQGSRVAFFDVQDAPARALVAGLAVVEGCPQPHFIPCDLTDVAALNRSVAEVIAAWGTIDVLVNNAANDHRHSIQEVTQEYWDRSMAVNLRPQFFAIQAVLPAMRRAGRGSIINMSSISWMIPSTGLPLYTTAKAAIVGLTRTMAHELGGDGIRVNAVLPGAIATEKQKELWYTPEYKAEIMASQALKRDILPDDVARLVLFLAADDSSAITSQSYVVDGGWV
jgi:NAD(P)-dependent dehydrogenase (short-subunit alcohol dehydrogenase family)